MKSNHCTWLIVYPSLIMMASHSLNTWIIFCRGDDSSSICPKCQSNVKQYEKVRCRWLEEIFSIQYSIIFTCTRVKLIFSWTACMYTSLIVFVVIVSSHILSRKSLNYVNLMVMDPCINSGFLNHGVCWHAQRTPTIRSDISPATKWQRSIHSLMISDI